MVMLARDEAPRIGAALDSIPADAERMVVLGDCADDTAGTAARHGARVVPQDPMAIRAAGGVFDVARDAAARQYARHPWIFYLDADERISRELAEEIGALAPGEGIGGFDMPRLNLYWGRPVRLLGNDHQIRLFRAGRACYPGAALHERVVVQGTVSRLSGLLIHDNIRHWSDARRLRRYVPVEARSLGRRPSRWETARAFDRRFSHYLLTAGAWRDGWRGAVVSALYALHHARVMREARRLHV